MQDVEPRLGLFGASSANSARLLPSRCSGERPATIPCAASAVLVLHQFGPSQAMPHCAGAFAKPFGDFLL